VFEDARLTRVEFVDCRLSGSVLATAQLDDVSFVGCRIDSASFRMAKLSRCAFVRSELVRSEFYESGIAGVSFLDCDLTDVDFSKARVDRVRLHGSTLVGLHGATALRGATIGSDQITAMGIVALDALGIVIDDE
jgi:uncharacterized protein YjbI with pentapeptide repeats